MRGAAKAILHSMPCNQKLEDEQADLQVAPQQGAEVSEAVLLVAIGGHALRPQSLQALSPHCLQPAQMWSDSEPVIQPGCCWVQHISGGAVCALSVLLKSREVSKQAQCLCRKDFAYAVVLSDCWCWSMFVRRAAIHLSSALPSGVAATAAAALHCLEPWRRLDWC